MTNMGFGVICQFLLSTHSLSCWQGEREREGPKEAVGFWSAKRGIRETQGHHSAVGRTTTFMGLIPKFPLGHEAGKRKEEMRK